MAAEYRRRCPGKALICDFTQRGWAFLCAGGSIPNLPKTTDRALLAAIPRLQPWPEASGSARWVLRGQGAYLVYLGREANPVLDLSHEGGTFVAKRVDLGTGQLTVVSQTVAGDKRTRLPKSPDAADILWLTKQ